MLNQGSIIKLRNRLWRVDDCQQDTFSATPVDGDSSERAIFLKTFESFEPANFREIDPDCPGDLANQQLLINAWRFELMHGSAPFMSLHRSSVVPYNYQLVPLVMAMEKKNCRMLLADDVGLGKTIEAGLILNEYLKRGTIRRILILTPASLKEQWKESLEYFFHIDSRIISSFTRKEFETELPPGVEPWSYFNVCIASVDYAKSPEIRYAIQKATWDFLVVDEIHGCAKPHAAGDHSTQMMRYELISHLASRIPHLLFLTATPHNGYTDSFASILNMINPEITENRGTHILIHKERARFNVCQRNRKSLEKWYHSQGIVSPFPKRNIVDVGISANSDIKFATLLEHVEQFGDQLIATRWDSQKKERIATWVALHLQKRAISSPYALRKSIENRLNQKNPLEELLREERDYTDSVNDIFPDDRTTEETNSNRVDQSLVTEEERAGLNLLLEECLALKLKDDPKFRMLKNEVIPELFGFDPKIILFTKYRDTLDYLMENLRKEEYPVFVLHGDLSAVRRREVFLDFERASSGILIATDVISEGLNLQHLASNMIHYELPWNPNRLEQRNGRIDRIGQKKATVQIRTLILEKTMEFDILDILLKKARTISEDRDYSGAYFGDEDSLAKKVQEARSRKRKRLIPDPSQLSIFSEPERPLTKEALYKSYLDPYADSTLDLIEKESFYNEMNIHLPEIDSRIRKTLEITGSREQVRAFVVSGFRKLGGEVTAIGGDIFRIAIHDKRLILPRWGNVVEPVTFDPEKALAHPDLIMLEPGHPLVRRLIEIVKSDFFETAGAYGRTACFYSGAVTSVVAMYHLLVRFTVGISEKQVIEELIVTGINLLDETVLNAEQCLSLKPGVTNRRPLPDQLRNLFSDALSHKKRAPLFQRTIDDKRKTLINERLELQQKILKETSTPEESQWIREIAVVEEAGRDLLTLTIVLPLNEH